MRRRRTATAEVYADFRGNSIKKPLSDKAKKGQLWAHLDSLGFLTSKRKRPEGNESVSFTF